MLSEKARKQLQMFLNTLEKETGFKPHDVWLTAFNGDQETAEGLQKHGMDLVSFNKNHWAEQIIKEEEKDLQIKLSYHYEPEEKPATCHRCQEVLTPENTCTHLMDETCLQCYDELAAEKHHEFMEYRESVL